MHILTLLQRDTSCLRKGAEIELAKSKMSERDPPLEKAKDAAAPLTE